MAALPPPDVFRPQNTNINEITITDIDFEAVESCTNPKIMAKYLDLLEEDGIAYQELHRVCKEKLGELNPKMYRQRYPIQS